MDDGVNSHTPTTDAFQDNVHQTSLGYIYMAASADDMRHGEIGEDKRKKVKTHIFE